MSPAMAAAAAVTGCITDVRHWPVANPATPETNVRLTLIEGTGAPLRRCRTWTPTRSCPSSSCAASTRPGSEPAL
jgi:hypothetical protein